jgi:hypothetical protein
MTEPIAKCEAKVRKPVKEGKGVLTQVISGREVQ